MEEIDYFVGQNIQFIKIGNVENSVVLNECEQAKKSLKECVSYYQKVHARKHDYYKPQLESLGKDLLVWDTIVKFSCSNDK